MDGNRPKTGAKLGEIIQTTAALIVGIAAGYAWRGRLSKARRAKERKWEVQLTDGVGPIELPPFLSQ